MIATSASAIPSAKAQILPLPWHHDHQPPFWAVQFGYGKFPAILSSLKDRASRESNPPAAPDGYARRTRTPRPSHHRSPGGRREGHPQYGRNSYFAVLRNHHLSWHDRWQGCALRRVDDGVELIHVIHPEIRQAERAADNFMHFERVFCRPPRELLHLARNLPDRLRVGASNDRC